MFVFTNAGDAAVVECKVATLLFADVTDLAAAVTVHGGGWVLHGWGVKKGVGDKNGLSKMLRWWVCRVLCEGGGGWRCSAGKADALSVTGVVGGCVYAKT